MTHHFPVRLIEKKRRGGELRQDELEAFFLGFLAGEVPDYQMGAFLMAVHFQGLSASELEILLGLVVGSGEVLDLSGLPRPKVDKHSTGGVGDKTSLVLAPLAAELGLCVPMMSGRGLGHTTGTLDKLEAIPGFRTRLTLREFQEILEELGVAMVGQTEEIAPLDRRLYALRDATATVPSIPLIAASIMGKKLAEGLQGLVLDVKTGSGAFLTELEDCRELAGTMARLGEARGVRTTALLTDMNAPLGRAVGNGLETVEAFRCLRGEGPPELADLSCALLGEMLYLGGLADDPDTGKARASDALARGQGVERMARLVERQGGDPSVVDDPDMLPRAPEVEVVTASEAGFVAEVSPLALGYGVVELGGGRRRMDDVPDLRVGFCLRITPGQPVQSGTPLGEVHAADAAGLRRGVEILRDAVVVEPETSAGTFAGRRSPGPGGLILERFAAS